METAHMAGRLRLVLRAFTMAALLLPSLAFAGTYGNGPYDSGVYGTGYVAPTPTPTSSGGGGQIYGSSPTAPGYQVGSTASSVASTTASTAFTAATSASTSTSSAISPSSAITSSNTSGLSDTQIQGILDLLQSFGANQSVIDKVTAALHGSATTSRTPTALAFTRDLDIGSVGNDVMALQVFLNSHGYIVANSGAGSVGQETHKFGYATQKALAKYQKDNDISPSKGYFGPKTRSALNK